MERLVDRAVAIAIHDREVLVMRRHKHGRDYCVLPGGGVEAGESPAGAVVRELQEETGLKGVVDRLLWTLEHRDRVAHYFLVRVERAPMALGGPETEKQSDDNRYTPTWTSLDELAAQNLQPEEVRDLLYGLAEQPRPLPGRC